MSGAVLVGAGVPEGTKAFAECFADGSAGIETKAVFTLEEVGEGEIVLGGCRGIGEGLAVEHQRCASASIGSDSHGVNECQ